MVFPLISKKEAISIIIPLLDEDNLVQVFDAVRKMKVNVSVLDELAQDIMNQFWYKVYDKKNSFIHISRFVSDDVRQKIRRLLISHGAARSVFKMCYDDDLVIDPADLLSLVCAAVQQVRRDEFPILLTYVKEHGENLDMSIQAAVAYLQIIQPVESK